MRPSVLRPPALLLPLMFAGCGDDFERRYDRAAGDIEARASSMDADLARYGATATPAAQPTGRVDPPVAPQPAR